MDLITKLLLIVLVLLTGCGSGTTNKEAEEALSYDLEGWQIAGNYRALVHENAVVLPLSHVDSSYHKLVHVDLAEGISLKTLARGDYFDLHRLTSEAVYLSMRGKTGKETVRMNLSTGAADTFAYRFLLEGEDGSLLVEEQDTLYTLDDWKSAIDTPLGMLGSKEGVIGYFREGTDMNVLTSKGDRADSILLHSFDLTSKRQNVTTFTLDRPFVPVSSSRTDSIMYLVSGNGELLTIVSGQDNKVLSPELAYESGDRFVLHGGRLLVYTYMGGGYNLSLIDLRTKAILFEEIIQISSPIPAASEDRIVILNRSGSLRVINWEGELLQAYDQSSVLKEEVKWITFSHKGVLYEKDGRFWLL